MFYRVSVFIVILEELLIVILEVTHEGYVEHLTQNRSQKFHECGKLTSRGKLAGEENPDVLSSKQRGLYTKPLLLLTDLNYTKEVKEGKGREAKWKIRAEN